MITQAVGQHRRQIPTAWRLLLGELRAGHRRWANTPQGDNYQRIIAHHGTGDYGDPEPYQRTLGDLVMPNRPVKVTSMCNVVALEADADADQWRLPRILSMVAMINDRGQQPSDLS